jgi:uncharacterized protein (TIGR02300 family)
MSTKAERGTKRTCRNPECNSRFYDLNRDPIVCPVCQTVFELAPAAMAAGAPAVQQAAAVARAPAKRPAYPVADAVKPDDVPAPEADEDALPALESDEEAPAGEEDETFLEAEEEDGSDMSNIIGGPVAETDEPDR